MLQPGDWRAIKLLLNGDMRHGCSRRGPVPVLFTGFEPDYIARANVLDCAALTLGPAAACRNDQRLPERVGVPGSKVTLAPATRAGSGALISGSMRTVPVKYSFWPLPEGCEPLRLISIFDLPSLNIFSELETFYDT